MITVKEFFNLNHNLILDETNKIVNIDGDEYEMTIKGLLKDYLNIGIFSYTNEYIMLDINCKDDSVYEISLGDYIKVDDRFSGRSRAKVYSIDDYFLVFDGVAKRILLEDTLKKREVVSVVNNIIFIK